MTRYKTTLEEVEISTLIAVLQARSGSRELHLTLDETEVATLRVYSVTPVEDESVHGSYEIPFRRAE